MAQPGSIGSMMPASEDTQLRKFADLERSVRELGPSIAASFQTTVETLQAQVAYQASLITRAVEGPYYSNSPIISDSTMRYVNSTASITLAVPTGRVIVSVGCASAKIVPGSVAAEANLTFNVTREGEAGIWWPSGTRFAAIYAEAGSTLGAGISKSVALDCGVGNRTFTLAFGSWSSSAAGTAAVFIDTPSISVQVINAA